MAGTHDHSIPFRRSITTVINGYITGKFTLLTKYFYTLTVRYYYYCHYYYYYYYYYYIIIITIQKSIYLKYISRDFFKEIFKVMSNLTNKRNAIEILSAYQILADITETALNMLVFKY